MSKCYFTQSMLMPMDIKCQHLETLNIKITKWSQSGVSKCSVSEAFGQQIVSQTSNSWQVLGEHRSDHNHATISTVNKLGGSLYLSSCVLSSSNKGHIFHQRTKVDELDKQLYFAGLLCYWDLLRHEYEVQQVSVHSNWTWVIVTSPIYRINYGREKTKKLFFRCRIRYTCNM